MPDPRRMLALLNARNIGIDRPGTGRPEITAADIAAAVAAVDDAIAQMIVLAKWAGYSIDDAKLVYGIAERHNPPGIGREKILRMVAMAVEDEGVLFPSICRTCNGRGEVKAGKIIVCHVCNGSGRRELSARKKARVIGVSPPTWKKYEPAYQDIRSFISRLESAALSTIRDRLR